MTNAGSTRMSIEDMIGHYQRSIEKSENDPKRLLHCLGKLYRMNVTVQHLQATGIGRTVNQLRKDDGEVGVAAKQLVSKWKEMVAAEESSECSEDDEEESADDPDETSGNDTERSPNERKAEKLAVHERRDSNSSDTQRIQSASRSHHQQYNYDSSTKSNVEDGSRKSSSHQHHNGHHPHHSNTQVRDTSHSRQRHSIDAAPMSSSRSSRKHSDENVVLNGNYEPDDTRGGGGGGTSNDDVLSENERTEKEHLSSHGHSDRNHKSKHHHGYESGHTSGRLDKVVSHKSSSSSTRDKERNGSNSNIKSDRIHGDASKRLEVDRKHHSDRNKSSSSSSTHKRRHEHEAITSHGDSSSQENGEMSVSKRHKCDTNSASSRSGSSRREHKKSSKSSRRSSATDTFEIDHSMGTSFADALGMIVPSTSKGNNANPSLSNKSSSKSASTSSHSSSKHRSSSGADSRSDKSSRKSSSSSSSKKVDIATLPPPLLSPKAELPPLEDISVDLPAPVITNNYRPMPLNPLVMDCVFKQQNPSGNSSKPIRMMTDEEALSSSISSKKERTKVFSGGKPGAKAVVLSLYDMCIRVLQKNIDDIEQVGDLSYDVLRPVLELATPKQLSIIEHYNPHLMDDTDVLWKLHCSRKFRTKQREEMETWRDMFFRCQTEQDERLNSLTNNIKIAQSVAVPVKQTKLTFIDSLVKPPRNVIKKQMQYGTESKLVSTPAARVAALSSVASNIARAGDVRLRTTAAMRDAAQVTASNSGLKSRKAPLMAKTLQLMKGRFKR